MAMISGHFSLRTLAGMAGLSLLVACGGGAGLKGAAAGLRGNQSIDLDSLPREKIEAFGTPILRARLPARGVDLLMSIRDTRGEVVTWESAEGITFAFRNGILIESRGLGPDLMSAAAPSPGQLKGAGSYPRSYFFVSEEERNEPRRYTCTPITVGPVTVEIYGKAHLTRLIKEECIRDIGRITNEFWYEAGILRQSRQWISPLSGYAEFTLVVD